jgi:glutamate-1-semialdehyde aminotransferase
MTVLVGSTSTQSRVKRPLPPGWQVEVIGRKAVGEKWKVIDAEGREFFHNINCTWVFDQGGPVLGYTSKSNPETKDLLAVVSDAERAGLFGPGSVATQFERQAADKLTELVGDYILGNSHKMRWLANGSDACDAAVRLSRAYTGRDAFVTTGYHGSSAIFSHKPQNAGIPESYTVSRVGVPWGDSDALARALETGPPKSCYIVEVPSEDEDAQSFLTYARALCDRAGTLLVLDEVVTGFRLAMGGAAETYGVKPDIACYGKAMSNGRGISAVVARQDISDLLLDRVFYSNTYNGDPYNCAHVLGTLLTMEQLGDELFGQLWGLGDELRLEMNKSGVTCVGHGPRTALVGSDYTELSQALAREGFIVNRPNYTSWAHNLNHVKRTGAAIRLALSS